MEIRIIVKAKNAGDVAKTCINSSKRYLRHHNSGYTKMADVDLVFDWQGGSAGMDPRAIQLTEAAHEHGNLNK